MAGVINDKFLLCVPNLRFLTWAWGLSLPRAAYILEVGEGATAESDTDVHLNLVESSAPWLPPAYAPRYYPKAQIRQGAIALDSCHGQWAAP